MPTKYVVTISSMGTSSVIAIPKPVMDGFGLKKGQKLDMIVRDDGIYVPLTENIGENYRETSGEEYQETSGETRGE